MMLSVVLFSYRMVDTHTETCDSVEKNYYPPASQIYNANALYHGVIGGDAQRVGTRPGGEGDLRSDK